MRSKKPDYPLVDVLMSAVAMFSLKDESLLQFDHQRNGAQRRHNLKTLYGVAKTPSDSQMRSALDGVDPLRLRPAFRAIHQGLQWYGVLEPTVFWGNIWSSSMEQVFSVRVLSVARIAVSSSIRMY